ncbi:glycosyltransferase [Mycobacterium avium subsp. hominissuis]|uniref:glycosyltransferase family 2 protein n=1 Tax=Mycobacterium avium TaxID=1764 RepID=UPI0003D1D701|nr:glycosyltransferase family 2 protein [Mycobacterium avium]ETB28399.1 glycosyltransferase [Mycobacterium avium subsp. hominissuis 10-4249]KDO95137.1 glycosyltransferase [Mycobacterium avium subsp. hominissuis A5]MBZ4558504.1 glycosyltransferase [Mycobacterium avium subsp. hominissuis]MBZ4568922.1 glycosyltransferase [Mycobacterium avium subsp. hominissuis]MBZ4586621.1 glycosyltransferase [Mycobacterium avium subsp. hominissuis]
MTAPMFSIIVPTFNAAATLQMCIESIICQTYSDLELVLVDGGSTDATLDVAQGFAGKLGPRLVVHSGPDQGPYDAMNRGVGMATGEWLLFLGADDALDQPDTLARVAAFIDDHETCDLVYGDVVMRSTGTRHAGPFDLDRLLFETNMCHQSIFYRRKLFEGIGPYNLRYPIWADWDFNIRCFSNPALVTCYMDIVVARYNDMTGLSMRESTDREFRKRLPMYFWVAAWETGRRMMGFFKQRENRRLALRAFVIRTRAASHARARR